MNSQNFQAASTSDIDHLSSPPPFTKMPPSTPAISSPLKRLKLTSPASLPSSKHSSKRASSPPPSTSTKRQCVAQSYLQLLSVGLREQIITPLEVMNIVNEIVVELNL